MVDIPITLPNGVIVPGKAPLVLIGPNGVGKSRLGTNLVSAHGYDRVPALRSLIFETSVPYQKLEDATREAESHINRSRNSTWQPSQELPSILSELKAEDSQSAVRFRAAWGQNRAGATPEITRLTKLTRLWRLTFPGRELDLDTYDPRVKTTLPDREGNPYAANQMSDGERGALYLIARVLRAKPGVVIVDEPEVHFHALLARSFWDVIEAERSDCRFIYITHDIPFALSRRAARIAIVRSEISVELILEAAPIPADLYESILGAVSLSIVAKRVVFCEGAHGRSIDPHFYGAWFKGPDAVVIPVGGCEEVERSVAVFKANPAIANGEALGLIDRDYWPDSHLAKLAGYGLTVLPTHEVEGLLCLPDVVAAVCRHLSKTDAQAATIQTEFETGVRAQFVGVRMNKLALERAKRELELKILGLANGANPDPDSAATRANLVGVVDLTHAVPDVGQVFDQQLASVATVLQKSATEFLTILPGKDCLGILCAKMGVTSNLYIDLVTNALSQPDVGGKPELEPLRVALVNALTPILPAR